MNQPKETILIAILTALLGAIMVLRNIHEIISRIKALLDEYVRYWKLRNERENQALEESRIRTAFWIRAVQLGIAEEKLQELNRRIGNKHEN